MEPQTSYSARDILVVVPCLDEERHIGGVIEQLLADRSADRFLIVIADGGSKDRTRETVAGYTQSHPNVLLLDNPKRLQSAAVNLAVETYGEGRDYFVRIDAHSSYPANYCSDLLQVRAEMDADTVVVSMHSIGDRFPQTAIAMAQNSVLGHGGSAHRKASNGRWVEHGHHALFSIAAFRSVGGYNETLSHNEDAELDMRLTGAGFRVFLAGQPTISYYPRSTFRALWKQYFNFGRGRARTSIMHRSLPNLRRAVLLTIAPAIAVAVLTPLSPIFLLPTLLWLFASAAYGVVLAWRHKSLDGIVAGFAGTTMQVAWSFGFYAGALGYLINQRDKAPLPA